MWGFGVFFLVGFFFFPFSLFALEELYGKIYHSRLGGSVLSVGLSSVSWMTSMLLWFFFSPFFGGWEQWTVSVFTRAQLGGDHDAIVLAVECCPVCRAVDPAFPDIVNPFSLSSTSPSEENVFSPWRLVPERRLLRVAVKEKMEALKTPYTFFS